MVDKGASVPQRRRGVNSPGGQSLARTGFSYLDEISLRVRTILINMQSMPSPTPHAFPRDLLRQTPAGVVLAQDLMGDRRVLLIEHAGERYQLRLTKNGKLILTK